MKISFQEAKTKFDHDNTIYGVIEAAVHNGWKISLIDQGFEKSVTALKAAEIAYIDPEKIFFTNEEEKSNEEKIREAYQELEKIHDDIMAKIKQAEKICNEYGIYFGLDVAYGMGGIYYGKGYDGAKMGDWVSSSQGC